MKKSKKWWQYLLEIPVVAIIDVVLLVAASLIDARMAEGGLGHGVPILTPIVILVVGLISIIVAVWDFVMCLRAAFGKNEPKGEPVVKPGKPKPVWRCFLPLIIEVPAFSLLLYMAGSYEIGSFYADPNHVGFAVPIGTLLLGAAFCVVTLVLGIICTIFGVKRHKKNRTYSAK